ncbi:MAG: class A beta-lactamase [Mycobacterium sp.]
MVARRDVLIGGLTLTALAAVGAGAASAAPAVNDRIAALEQRSTTRIGLFAVDLQSGRTVAHRENDPFAMCSTFKTYAAARVLQKAQRGELTLTDTVTVAAEAILPNSPVTETRIDQPITLSELCAAALQRSDNAAANYLLQAIGGPTAITEFARSIGDHQTRLDRWEIELNSALPGDLRDTSTPRALGEGYRDLIVGSALAPASREQLVAWMTANVTSSLRPGLPPEWILADKTGSGDYGTTNDVGVGFGPGDRRVLISAMVRSATDDPDAEGVRPMMAELAALVLPVLLDQSQ